MDDSGDANSPQGRLRARLRMLAAKVRAAAEGSRPARTGNGRLTIAAPPSLEPDLDHMLALAQRRPRR